MANHPNWAKQYRYCVEEILRQKARGVDPHQLSKWEKKGQFALPKALRTFYHHYGRTSLHRAHNRLLSPQKIRREGNYLVFYEENQNVAVWAISLEDKGNPDPPVYQGWAVDEEWSWQRDEEQVSQFLLAMSYWQAVCGGLTCMAEGERKPDGSEPWQKWKNLGNFSPFQVWGKQGVVVAVMAPLESGVSAVFGGSDKEETLAEMETEKFEWAWITESE